MALKRLLVLMSDVSYINIIIQLSFFISISLVGFSVSFIVNWLVVLCFQHFRFFCCVSVITLITGIFKKPIWYSLTLNLENQSVIFTIILDLLDMFLSSQFVFSMYFFIIFYISGFYLFLIPFISSTYLNDMYSISNLLVHTSEILLCILEKQVSHLPSLII